MTPLPPACPLPHPQRLRLLKAAAPRAAGLSGVAQLPPALRALGQRLLPVDAAGPPLRLDLPAGCRQRPPRLGDDESYRLHISADRVLLQAATLAGARHGLHSLSQLWQDGPPPALSLQDAPRHAWRGLLVDSARRPLPLDALLRLLDTLAAAKLNVLHWHLSDDQAWRLESPRYPRLHERASGGFFYTLGEAERLVQEAAARGIRVLPELDLPGHCWGLGLAYPELLCAPAPRQAQTGFGVFPCAVDPTQEALYDFLDGLLGEWRAVFPDPYLHLGGDELAPAPWQALAAERGCSVADLQALYVRRVGELLDRHRRRLVAWDEMASSRELPAGSLLQAWRGGAALAQEPSGLAGRLRSAGYYLDQSHGAAWHWRRPLQAPRRPPAPPPEAECWALQAVAGLWRIEGRLWRHAGQAWLQLRSSGSLDEWLQPRPLADPLVRWRLQVDSDLGELEFWGPEQQALQAGHGGWLRLGNLRLRCAWWALPAGSDWPPRHRAARTPLLGGEAALWGELVDAPQLALRTRERLFAVAERLWRDPQGADEAALHASLAQRLARADDWLQRRVHPADDPLQPRWRQLAPEADERAQLQALAAWLEPGAGYARQHDKKAHGRYQQGEALSQLVDLLPAESRFVQQLGDEPAAWRAALRDAERCLPTWTRLLQQQARAAELLPLLDRLEELFALGLQLWGSGRLPAAKALQAQRRLHAAGSPVGEMVPALLGPLQRQLDRRLGLRA